MSTYADRSRACRKRLGLSQQAVATTLGVALTTMGNWEVENRPPDVDTLNRQARAYGVRFEWLAIGKGPMSPKQGQ